MIISKAINTKTLFFKIIIKSTLQLTFAICQCSDAIVCIHVPDRVSKRWMFVTVRRTQQKWQPLLKKQLRVCP